MHEKGIQQIMKNIYVYRIHSRTNGHRFVLNDFIRIFVGFQESKWFGTLNTMNIP